MPSNPVEENFLARFVLGLAVITAMFVGGGAVGSLLLAANLPYGDWIGAGVGAVAVFAAFVVAYRRYDASFDPS